jgi:hypothetical protein
MDRDTERRRLARLLRRPPEALDYLDALDAATLFRLRGQVQNALIQRLAPIFEKLAAGGRLIPDALNARLCTGLFGPGLTARLSTFTPTEQAVRLAAHFDTAFLTEVARHQVPERAQALLQALPLAVMREVTRQLLAAGEFAVMGGYTDYLPEAKAEALIAEIRSPEQRLQVSAWAQRKDRIARLSARLPEAELAALIAYVAQAPQWWKEVLLITAEMPDEDQRRMAARCDAQDRGLRLRAAAAIADEKLHKALSAFFTA